MEPKELAIQRGELAEKSLPPHEVADSILLAFKAAIKRAGSYSEAEYQLQYRQTENQLKMYLSHLLELIPLPEEK